MTIQNIGIRRKTASIIIVSILFIFTALFIFLNIIDNLYTALIVILGVFITNDMFINSRVNKVSEKIIRQIPEVFTIIRHSFHEHGMIEEAFDDAIDELEEKEITPQIKKIKEAILSSDPEGQLEKYYDTAPNRFLKLFAGLSFLTMELGDRKINGISVYLKNLNNILNDAYIEILKKDRINYLFRSLTSIAVAPLFFVELLENWSVTNFPSLQNFYNSSFGLIIKITLLVSIFVSYFILKILKDDANDIKFDKILSKRWQEKAYRLPIIRNIVNGLMPKQNTRKYKIKEKAIKSTSSYLTIEWLYVNKITYAAIAFLMTIILILNMTHIDIQAIYNNVNAEFLSLGKLSDDDSKKAKEATENDKKLVQKLKNEKDLEKEDIKAAITLINGQVPAESDVERILTKIEKIQSIYVKFWQVLIALLIGWLAYFIPDIIITVKNKIRAMEKEDEVMQFQSIILMLMYIERVDVQTILEWLERYSYAYKESISTCLNNYEAGAVEALEELRDSVPYREFQRMVEAFISAVERIPIKDAFDELETERAFYYEKRKEANSRIIEKKSLYGKVVGFTPMVVLLGGYFIGPLLTVSVLQLMVYFETMQMS